MKRKRILLSCNRTLTIGGIEKALITFLKVFDTTENDVTLVLHDLDGVFCTELPLDRIQVICTKDVNAIHLLKDDIQNFRLREIWRGLWNRFMLRIDPDWYAQIMYTYRLHERGLTIPGHFDCAISYSTDYSDLSIILAADADKRIAFVHGDATQHKRAAKLNDHLLRRMDKIFCVSERAKDKFLFMHPSVQDKTDVMYNVVLANEILSKSNAPADGMNTDGYTALCTVGRLSPEKGQQLIPEIAMLLKKAGHQFRWFVVGDGSLRPELENSISAYRLEDDVILLGSKVNPYPYMNKCDIYIQTSYSEAHCLTVAEAKVLCKPIVATDVPGITEQITDGFNGFVVNETTAVSLFERIQLLIQNPLLCSVFQRRLIDEKYADQNPLQKLYDYLNN